MAEGRGFAVQFSLSQGWGPSYPETSGYIVPTLLLAGSLDYRREECLEAAMRTGRWLLQIQHPGGAYDAPSTRAPMVFDTGQILFGLLALAGTDRQSPFLLAARRAGDWIVDQQDAAGYWVASSYNGIPHTYYARVSWALLVLSIRTGNQRYRDAARRQLAWVLSRQDPDGWFHDCSFMADGRPILHVIAYTIRGLWESSLLLEDPSLESAAVRAADALCRREEGRGWLPSHFLSGWTPSGRSACLTGLCQISGIWLRVARKHDRKDLAAAARRCLDFVKGRQVSSRLPELSGAVPGSAPLWGEYFPWAYPNWGVKFLLDGLMLVEGLGWVEETCG